MSLCKDFRGQKHAQDGSAYLKNETNNLKVTVVVGENQFVTELAFLPFDLFGILTSTTQTSCFPMSHSDLSTLCLV